MRSFILGHLGELLVGFVVAVALGILAVLKGRFASKAGTWPTVAAKIENVFLDVTNRGPNHIPFTHAVLAYAYSVGDGYYSGEIRLLAGEGSLDSLDKELVGGQIAVQYDPNRPEVSVFLKHKVRGWLVVKDRRLSLWAWLDNLQ
jgi:hypothetical protein